MDSNWKKYNGELIQIPIEFEVEKAILRELSADNNIRICIGTDSQVKGATTEIATVIVFVRERQGAYMFVNKSSIQYEMSLKERLMDEVGKSIEIAYLLKPLLDKYQIGLEVHADINANPEFRSSIAYKEASGYIQGMGFDVITKPDSFASSTCADKIV